MRTMLNAVMLLALAAAGAAAGDWPQWRGPQAIGVSPERGLPVSWDASENVGWKARLGGLGVSSPIAWGDHVFVTSQVGHAGMRPGSHPALVGGQQDDAGRERPLGGRRASDPTGPITFLVEAFRRADGRRLWVYQVEAVGPMPPLHQKHNFASPTPVTDGEMVYAWFGTGQVVALDLDGSLVWQRHLGTEYSPFQISWGHGSSPVLYEDSLILLCDHEPASYLLAVDKRTGRNRWKIDREKGSTSYSTPVVVPGPRGDELIVNSSRRIDAYDPATGEFLWHAGEPNRFPIPTPVFRDGRLYASRGYRSGPYMAIRLGGRGDVSKTHVEWVVPTGAPYISSLVYHDGLIYMANDGGIVTCVDADTGERVWQERVGGIFAASPIAADGRVYLFSETGETVVLEPGRSLAVLARNDIGERTVAIPAFSNGQIFIRTDEHLWAIGKPADRSQ